MYRELTLLGVVAALVFLLGFVVFCAAKILMCRARASVLVRLPRGVLVALLVGAAAATHCAQKSVRHALDVRRTPLAADTRSADGPVVDVSTNLRVLAIGILSNAVLAELWCAVCPPRWRTTEAGCRGRTSGVASRRPSSGGAAPSRSCPSGA